MQSPEQRKALIKAGLYNQLEPPENLGQPWVGRAPLLTTASMKAFKHTVADVFEREPGQEG